MTTNSDTDSVIKRYTRLMADIDEASQPPKDACPHDSIKRDDRTALVYCTDCCQWIEDFT